SDLVLGDVDKENKPIRISMKDLGIEMPVLVSSTVDTKPEQVTDPNVQDPNLAVLAAGHNAPRPLPCAAPARSPTQTLPRYDFVVQFLWKPTPISARQAKRDQLKKQQEQLKNPTDAEPQVANNSGN